MMLLQASMFRLTCIRILSFSSSSSAQLRSRTIRCKMSAEPSPLTHSINIPGQPGESFQIVAGPGVSDSEFRSVIVIVLLDPFGLLSFLSHLIYFCDQLKVSVNSESRLSFSSLFHMFSMEVQLTHEDKKACWLLLFLNSITMYIDNLEARVHFSFAGVPLIAPCSSSG